MYANKAIKFHPFTQMQPNLTSRITTFYTNPTKPINPIKTQMHINTNFIKKMQSLHKQQEIKKPHLNKQHRK